MILDLFGRGNVGVVTVKQPAEIGDDNPNTLGSYHSSILSSKRFRISRQLLLWHIMDPSRIQPLFYDLAQFRISG